MSKAVKVVEMLVGISGTRNGEEWPPKGGTVALPAPEADDLIAGGLAREASNKEPEKATAPKGETRKGLTKASMG